MPTVAPAASSSSSTRALSAATSPARASRDTSSLAVLQSRTTAAVERRVDDRRRLRVAALQEAADGERRRARLEAAGVAQPEVGQVPVLGREPGQRPGDGVLADLQVLVVRVCPGLARGHAGGDGEPGADEVEQQLELDRLERRDVVVARGDVADHPQRALGLERGVGAGDRETGHARSRHDVPEVHDGRRPAAVDEDVVGVAVVVDQLARQRLEAGQEALVVVEGGAGEGPGDPVPDPLEGVALGRGLQRVPAERPGARRVVEPARERRRPGPPGRRRTAGGAGRARRDPTR